MKWTTALITAAVVPTIALAQNPTYGRDTARAQGRDTGRAHPTQRNPSRDNQRVRAESRGNVEMSRRGARARTTWGLSSTQISALQQSLQSIDCYDGEIDGLIGPRTRVGISCAMRHHNITGSDPNELAEALGLDFEIDAKAGLGSVMRSGAAARGRRDTQGTRQRDSAGRGTRDTLQAGTPTPTPTPQNVPPR